SDGDGEAAAKWATECLYINVYDPLIHVLVADAQVMGKKFQDATLEYQTALSLKPRKPDDVKVKLARAQLGAGRRKEAKATLDEVLKADPEHPEGKALAEEMEKSKSE